MQKDKVSPRLVSKDRQRVYLAEATRQIIVTEMTMCEMRTTSAHLRHTFFPPEKITFHTLYFQGGEDLNWLIA